MSRNYELLNKINHEPRAALASKQHTPRILNRGEGKKVRPPAPADWGYLLVALRRHWSLGLSFLAVVLIVTALVTFLSKPVYQPTAKVEVDPPGTELFSLQANNPGSTDIDRLIQTQTQILNSDELAIKVIRELRLDTRPDVAGKLATSAAENTTGELSPAESAALLFVRQKLRAAPVKNSQTIEISFASHDPRLSQDVVNSILKSYLNKNYQTRFDAVTQSSEWLSRQLVDIKEKAAESAHMLAEYQKAHAIADVGDQQSTFAVRIGELSKQVTQAGADRIQLESFARAIKEGKGDSLPQVRDSPVIQNLASALAKNQAELAQTEVIYGKNHPNVQKLKNAVATTEAQLKRERSAILTGIQTSYAAASAREQLMTQQLESATAGVGAVGEYTALKHEAQANTDLYNTLYARVKEAGITAASKSSNVRVLEEARLLDRPTRPVPLQNMTLAMVFGLVGGLALIFLRDRFDSSLRTPEDLPGFADLPTITFVPRIPSSSQAGQKQELPILLHDRNLHSVSPFLINAPYCDASEAIRTLVSSLLNQSSAPRVLLISSAFQREGKTTVAVNLAVAFSELGETCIVDADLRRPTVAPSFGVPLEPGLGTVLKADAPLSSILRVCPSAPNLWIAPAGHTEFNPGALLMSDAATQVVEQLRQRFRYVIVDSPPILSYADARALAPLADGVVLVGRYGYTGRAGVERTIGLLQELHCNVLGFVFNGVDASAVYGYYGTGSSQSHHQANS